MMNTVNKQPVYLIIPVHNRKTTTLKCLKNLAYNGDLQRYYVVVVDDGSTDGTSQAIESLYPEVIILTGDGNLWWTGAIKKGMEYAYKKEAEYLIWLNDDCYPTPNAVSTLLNFCQSHPRSIVGGQCLDPDTNQATYGGIISKNYQIQEIHSRENKSIECDGLSGNFVCFHRTVIDDIDYPNVKLYPQYYGDVTYTHLAKIKGYKIIICGEVIAYNKNDHPLVSWMTPERPLISYWKEAFTVKSPYYWKAEFNYYREILGWLGIGLYLYQRLIKFWLIFLLFSFLPISFRQKIKSAFKKYFNQKSKNMA